MHAVNRLIWPSEALIISADEVANDQLVVSIALNRIGFRHRPVAASPGHCRYRLGLVKLQCLAAGDVGLGLGAASESWISYRALGDWPYDKAARSTGSFVNCLG